MYALCFLVSIGAILLAYTKFGCDKMSATFFLCMLTTIVKGHTI